jgi:dipeptidyl aminopeptidase/acylaminoacyl peptidase
MEWACGRDRDTFLIVSGQARMAANPYEARERYIAQSAFFHLDKVNTPVMIVHGMKDNIVLFEEGEMMFYALRQLGNEAVFVIYTHGDHSIYRHSRSDALDLHRRMLEWFKKYLKRE